MKTFAHTLIVVIIVLVGASCGRRSQSDVLHNANEEYSRCLLRYQDIVMPQVDEAVLVEKVRLFGMDYHLSFWSTLWVWLTGKEHLTNSDGNPLHRAVYLINKDIDALSYQAQQLERRVLTMHPIYARINDARCCLCKAIRVVQAHSTYTQESQFIESQTIQHQQLAVQNRQARLLEKVVKNN